MADEIVDPGDISQDTDMDQGDGDDGVTNAAEPAPATQLREPGDSAGAGGARSTEGRWPYAILMLITVAALAFSFSQWRERRHFEVAIGNQYFHSFYDLVENVDNVRVSLGKSLAAGSPRLRVSALSDVWREASNAQANLTNLPVSQHLLSRTAAFLTQVGDFAFSTARKLADQQMMTDEDWKRLVDMRKQSDDLASGLAKMSEEAAAGRINWTKVAAQSRSELRKGAGGAKAGGAAAGSGAPASGAKLDAVNDGFTRVDEQVQQFPTLIYDGPFSDHLEARQPVGVTGAPITADQAKEIARKVVPFDASGYTTSVDEEVRGKIPVYRVAVMAPKKSGKPDATVDVTRVGGHIALINVVRSMGPKKLDLSAAVDRAGKYLTEIGKPNMQPTFASEVGDMAIIPFAYKEGTAIVYPDQIKVKVALDTGDILSYDAVSYLSNHKARTIPAPKITEAEASKLLSPAFSATGPGRLAVIPVETVDTPEAVCWEFHGTSMGDEFFVYIDTQTGREEKILQLMKTSEGTLTL